MEDSEDSEGYEGYERQGGETESGCIVAVPADALTPYPPLPVR